MLRKVGISLLLAAVTAGIYAGVREHEFVDFDDLTVIVRNPDLRPESLGAGIARAFSANLAGNWIPATIPGPAAWSRISSVCIGMTRRWQRLRRSKTVTTGWNTTV